MTATTALEGEFPILPVSRIAEQESWRKEINRPLYHIHKWWATRLGSVFRAITLAALSPPNTDVWASFYTPQDFKGKVVLDPFMGSGTTLGEAVKLGAKAIGCDINPISTFLVRQAFAQVPEATLRAKLCDLEREVAPSIRRYYQTRDRTAGGQIPVLYFFWVKTVSTRAGEVVPLFSRWVFAQDAYPKRKPTAQILCSSCWGVFKDRYDTHQATCPHCQNCFDPQRGPASGQYVTDSAGTRFKVKDLLPTDQPPAHRLYAILALKDDGTKVYLSPTEEDLRLYSEAKTRLANSALPVPTMAVRPGHNTDQARGYNYKRWRDFFNERQLLCLSLLLEAVQRIEDVVLRDQFLCLFSSTLEFNNMFCSFKGEGTGAVRHMFSNHILKPERQPLENSVWGTAKSSGTFSTLFESRLIKAKRYLDEPFEVGTEPDLFGKVAATKVIASAPMRAPEVASWSELTATDKGLLILNGDSSRLPVPSKSVDAVITDPPYFDFVHYSELSDFFFAWLAPAIGDRYPGFDRADSSHVGEVQQKNPRDFARQLGAVFTEAARVLKDDGVLAFSFHHSRAEGWAAIYEALKTSGMVVVAAHPVHAELRGASPKTAAKAPISLDAILVCKKRSHAVVEHFTEWPIAVKTAKVAKQLEQYGLRISDGDRFVIAAAEVLIAASKENFSFSEVSEAIERAKASLHLQVEDASEVEEVA